MSDTILLLVLALPFVVMGLVVGGLTMQIGRQTGHVHT